MSRLEKIRQLDREIKESLRLCESEGMSDAEIRAAAAPVVGFHEMWRRKERLRTLIYLSVAVVVVAALYQSTVTSEFISAIAKLGMVKLVLPYWDWTRLHQRDCVFENPYRATNEITAEDCLPLADLTTVEREEEMGQDEMAEDYLFASVPVIITDDMDDWRAFQEPGFDHQFITKLYNEDPVLSNTTVCGFSRSDPVLYDFLDKMEEMNNFQVHWGHCKLTAAKVLRTFYRRPYFLPGMVEADPKNYLAVGMDRDHTSDSDYTVYKTFNMQMIWFGQVKGHFKFKLFPHKVCSQTISILEGTLDPGEILVYGSDMWQLHYAASGETEAVAIISGGSWE